MGCTVAIAVLHKVHDEPSEEYNEDYILIDSMYCIFYLGFPSMFFIV